MTTVLDKELKRQVDISGTAYTVVIDPAGLRLVEKGKRKPVALLAWKDPVSGEAPLAVALQASVKGEGANPPPPAPARLAPRLSPALWLLELVLNVARGGTTASP